MKMWICRDQEGLAAFIEEPKKYYPNPIDENDYWWIASGYDEPIMLNPYLFPEVTFENSPMEVELKLVNDVQG